jgi:uncharacterized protein YfaS (alpha-2-macroglobulin family)
MRTFFLTPRWRLLAAVILLVLIGMTITAAVLLNSAQTPSTFNFTASDDSSAPITAPSETDSTATTPEETSAVLGDYTGSMYFTSGQYTYSDGGVLAQSSRSEPSLQLNSHQLKGDVAIAVYEATIEDIIGHVLHDAKGQRYARGFDYSQRTKITDSQIQVTSSNTSISLPTTGSGVWYVTANHASSGVQAGTFLVRSSQGTIVKEGENSFIIWTQDFQTGKSVAGASVELLDLTGSLRTVSSGTTNAEGILELPYQPEVDIAVTRVDDERSIVPINIESFYEADINSYYKRFREKTIDTKIFSFTDRPLYQPGDTIYFKSILRRDDDARYSLPSGMVTVKIFSDWKEDSLLFEKRYPISSAGSIDGEFKLPADAPATENYRLSLSLDNNQKIDRWNGSYSTYFSVAYYRKPDYFLTAAIDKLEYIAQDEIAVQLAGEYFSGPPLAGANAKYRVTASEFYDWEFENSFAQELDNNLYWYGYGEELAAGEVTLDELGKGVIRYATPKTQKNSDRVYSVEIEYLDSSGNPSLERKQVLVRAAQFGVYRSGEYQYSFQKGQNISLPLRLIPVKNSQNVTANRTLIIEGVRSHWEEQPREAGQKYPRYTEIKKPLQAQTIKTNAQGAATLTLRAEEAGSHEFTVSATDTLGNEISKKFYVYVSDSDSGSFTRTDSEQNLSVTTDKSSYQPENAARIMISSADADRDVLLSIERARTDRYQVVSMKGRSSTVNIPLKENDMPNQFAVASTFSSERFFENTAKVVVSPDRRKMNISLKPDREEYGPGDTVTVDVTATDTNGRPVQGELTLWTVDKSLFELASTNLGKIFETFWNERYHSAPTTHSLKGISSTGAEGGGCFTAETPVLLPDRSEKPISKVQVGDEVMTRASDSDSTLVTAKVTAVHETETTGVLIINGTLRVTLEHVLWVNNGWQQADAIQIGDTLTDSTGTAVRVESIEWLAGAQTVYNLTVENQHTYFAGGVYVHNEKGVSRTVFKDTAYWNPRVITDEKGKATVRFKLPDNLTTWMITGVGANSATVVGQAQAEIKVGKAVVVRPIVPNILRSGDTVTLAALIHNFTDTERTFSVKFAAPSSTVADPLDKQLTIAPRRSLEVGWEVAVGEGATEKITFAATASDDESKSDAITLELPIVPYGFMRESVFVGNGALTQTIALDPTIDRSRSELQVFLSPTLLGTLPAGMEYLLQYPYGCVEQTTSSLVPILVARQHPKLFATALAKSDVEKKLAKGVERLSRLQTAEGGWGWWHEGKSDPFITAYVYENLLLAKQQGVKLPSEMIERVERYAQSMLGMTKQQHELVTIEYILALQSGGKNARPQLVTAGLPSDLLALAVITNVRNGYTNTSTNGVQTLIAQAQETGAELSWSTSSTTRFASTESTTALASRALLIAGADRELAEKAARGLMRRRQQQYWGNTFGTAQVIRAITDLYSSGGESKPSYAYALKLNDRTITTSQVTSATTVLEPISIPLVEAQDATARVELTQTGEGQLYSTIIAKQFITDRAAKPENKGLQVTREYINEKGREYSLGVGDLVTVKIEVSGIPAVREYLVVEDILPAGLIAIDQNRENTGNRNQFGSFYDGAHREITREGITLSGPATGTTHSFSYQARVLVKGTFYTPPATASMMYTPEISGHSGAEVIAIEQEARVVRSLPLEQQLESWISWLTPTVFRAILAVLALGVAIAVLVLHKRSVARKREVKQAANEHTSTMPAPAQQQSPEHALPFSPPPTPQASAEQQLGQQPTSNQPSAPSQTPNNDQPQQ